MRLERGRRFVVVCSHVPCSEIFTRRTCEVVRSPRSFCSRACFSSVIRTGHATVECACDGCGALFVRLKSEAHRRWRKRQFCSTGCYDLHADRQAMGRAGGSAPHQFPPGFTVARARLAGAATARARSKEDWAAFSRMGVEAQRRKLSAEQRSAASRRGQLLARIGTEVVLGVRLGKDRDAP